ncbi:MAG TPA: endonuclease/exonuclease/phosphatase family protein [Phototrophicaceae bacterium]|nr:endonuclease/exonuclease/phosphatase family protein [Phototrophicaceae bacterium]
MLKRLHFLTIIEAGFTGLFFVQALHFLIGMLYSRVAGASAVTALQSAQIAIPSPAVDPALVNTELTFLLYMIALPLLTLILGRFRVLIVVAAAAVAVGRLLMMPLGVLTPTAASALVIGAGLVYVAMIARYRAQILPYMFILGFGADQLFRAVGNTVDPSLSSDFLQIQIGLTVVAILISLIAFFAQRQHERAQETEVSPDFGLIPFWGAIGLGGLLYLELALLGQPNTVAGRADTDYTIFAPFVLAATLLPLIPFIRGRARAFVAIFDGNVRGWLWMLLIALLIIFGMRLQGIVAGAALVLAQFFVSLLWWWLVRPRAERQRSFGGLWLILGVLLFALLVVGDNFTYEYAFVRDFAGNFAFLNTVVPPLLRGFRGLGMPLALLAVFLAALPMTQTQRRIPWNSHPSLLLSLGTLVIVIAASIGASVAVRPPVIQGVRGVDEMRVATYNIHDGYDQFYNSNLEAVAHAIQESGANVVLMQDVDAGRLSSFGVDQSLWLARRLGMDRRFFATNEGLQGLAVLSNMQIAFDDGHLLTSLAEQTGVQRVQVLPTPDTVVTLYNVSLSPLLELSNGQTVSDQEQDQQQQLNEIFAVYVRQACNASLGRTIIGGTMYNVPDSPLADQMRNAQFSDPFAGLPLELSATFVRTGFPAARFDYLWTCNLPSLGAGVLSDAPSDHRLAVADLVLTRQPAS